MLEAMKAWEPSEDDLILVRRSLGVNSNAADIAHLSEAMIAAYKATTYATVRPGNTPDISAAHTCDTE
jgi:hypothetical protein